VRLAVISDVHGNTPALRAVLADIAGQDVDVTVNLGDLLSGGLEPARTADLLIPLELLTVRGNHERQVLEDPDETVGRSDRFARQEMTAEHLAWFASLPATVEPAPGVLGCHGTPTSDLTYLLHTVSQGRMRPSTDAEIRERLAGSLHLDLILCGHTHLAAIRRVAGGPLVVNPGSVGWPAYDDDQPEFHLVEAGSPHARYAVVDDATGTWTADLRQVTYDWTSAAGIAVRNGRPDLVRPLTEGRV